MPYFFVQVAKKAGLGVVQMPIDAYSSNQKLVDLAAVVDKTAQLSSKVASTRANASSALLVTEDYLMVMSSLKQT